MAQKKMGRRYDSGNKLVDNLEEGKERNRCVEER